MAAAIDAMPDHWHWVRVVMSRVTKGVVRTLHPETRDALEISGDYWAGAGWASYAKRSYPEFDICDDHVELRDKFDFIAAEQVLEHVPDPERAVSNIHAMLRPGGVALVTTPFMIRFHDGPADYSRWTAAGLANLMHRGGFTNIAADSWGNRDCVVANFTHWVTYDPSHHSLTNEPEFPVAVWVFGEK